MVLLLLCATAVAAEDLEISWNYAADMTDVTGFRLYANTTGGEYVAEDVIATVSYATGQAEYTTNATIAGIPGTVTTWYFVGTAYNDTQESDYSNEVTYDVLGAPENLTFTVNVPVE